MTTADTTVTPDPAELAGPVEVMPEGLDFLALAGQLMPGLGDLIATATDPDATTLDDVAESLDELHGKLDWLAGIVMALAGKLPGKFAVTPPPYPS